MKCLSCAAETTNGLALDARCQQTLSVALVNVAAFYADVLRIQPGQRIKVRAAYQSAPPPASFPGIDPITATTAYVDTIIVGWVRNLEDDRPELTKAPGDIVKACAWLEDHITTIATLEWGGEIVREMLDCERRLQRLIDRSDTGWYAGICGNEIGRETVGDEILAVTCERRLYGTAGTSWVRCPECGRTWDAGARREVMMREARDEVAPLTVIARAVVGLTDETSEERLTRRITRWIDRGQLRDLGVRVIDGRPRRVYNLGEVFDLVSGEVKPRDAKAC